MTADDFAVFLTFIVCIFWFLCKDDISEADIERSAPDRQPTKLRRSDVIRQGQGHVDVLLRPQRAFEKNVDLISF
jgi:hypothetical protein